MSKRYVKLESTAINSVEYDDETKEMVIEFKSSGKYTYYEVPAYHMEALISAKSAGRYFNQYIRKYSVN